NFIAGTIAASVEEQSATTMEVSRVITEAQKGVEAIAVTTRVVSQAASENTVAATQTLEASRGLSQLSENLAQLVRKVRN
ncbi:MAG: methyl-accepting chemotaxis protein, partial [Bdellovibrionia bacterium]